MLSDNRIDAETILVYSLAMKNTLFAGASKVLINPETALFPFNNIVSMTECPEAGKLYVKIFSLRCESTRVLIAVFEAGDAPGRAFKEKLAHVCGVPAENIVAAGIHNHAFYWGAREKPICGHAPGPASPQQQRYEAQVFEAACRAAEEAIRTERPARAGLGTGVSPVNHDRTGVSPYKDHTLSVLRFEDENGTLIGAVFNFPCHEIFQHRLAESDGVFRGNSGMSGVALSILERRYPGAVLAWTCAAGADQGLVNGIYDGMRHALDCAQVLDTTMCSPVSKILITSGTALLNGSVQMKTQVLLLEDIAVLAYAAEIYSELGRKIIRASPLEKTMLISSTDRGHAGYLVSDAKAGEDNFMTKDITVPGNLDSQLIQITENIMKEVLNEET